MSEKEVLSLARRSATMNLRSKMEITVILLAFVIIPASGVIPDMAKTTAKLRRLAELPFQLTKSVTYRDKFPKTNKFDYIVVGSGPSGCVIANRLTADDSTSVLLIEAGKEDNMITDIPLLNPLISLTGWSWNYDTVPTNDTCLGMTHERCPWPSGKGPGGGTILNAMIWTRGNPLDYDRWAQMGLAGWSYEELLPYFKRSENTRIAELSGSEYHGRGGPLSIEYPPFRTRLSRDYINAGKSYGFQEVDYNDPRSHIGFGKIQLSMEDGERMTSATAFIKPILNRPNLSVTMDSRVIKILIDPKTKAAYGVRYVRKGKEYDVFARKEVIVSAGAFGSPHLLLLSGIGPARHLRDVGIRPIVDLPVGENLMEHQGMHGLTFTIDTADGILLTDLLENIVPVSATYVGKNRGVLTSPGCEVISYVRTKYANLTMPADTVPDVELLFISGGMQTDDGRLFRKSFGISDELYDYTYKPHEGRFAFSIWPMLMYPRSRGRVRLKDDNPLSKPIIDHGFFTDPQNVDMLTLIEGIKIAVMLAKTPPLRKYGADLVKTPFPNCRHIQFGSDEYWECAVRTMSTQFHHQSGTCAMGSVVDSRLRVIGVQGLRVADASVIPTIPGAHIQAAAYMIGEKAADLIREDVFYNNIIR
ncbi:glucose dehydrogenase [Nesidiocoris tenuis]|uniref:Glucose dehydrogenase n=1 Tax=Nesidiocoris tenuis TaxID=355587 RepID=A0ABN7BC82_9HEMI|nr:glucose dehydrogenase [Nesidiocoris tenuis]